MKLSLAHPDVFADRHLGPSPAEVDTMLAAVGARSLDTLVNETVPESIRLGRPLALPPALAEHELLAELRAIASKNQVCASYLGLGYYGTVTPPVIQRNILENPGWYTQYTPYQAEISQGRLEALLNYQQMVMDLTGLAVANASLLDEATAAAEAMAMAWAVKDHPEPARFLVDHRCHPQTIAVVMTRAEPIGVEVVVADAASWDFAQKPVFGVLVQTPDTEGVIRDFAPMAARARAAGAVVACATDLLALTMITPPGEWGADIAVGSSQRFGVPLGYGGPHAAFMATRADHVRKMPGRLIGVSQDAAKKTALRMALATREQHIRREKATSNICTAQVLLAVTASMYAVYHGPKGLFGIATRVHSTACALAAGLGARGLRVAHADFFDTVRVDAPPAEIDRFEAVAAARRINLRRLAPGALAIALDETVGAAALDALLGVFGPGPDAAQALAAAKPAIPAAQVRTSAYLTHAVFNRFHAEHEMLRYIKRLERRDLSLTHSMIPLGSCTMKLNAAAEMLPITWPELGALHPFVPREQAAGYTELHTQLEAWLREITGFAAISLQPNAGSQGEYTGLMVIRAHHKKRGQSHRNVCLIPQSAHGTNPATATMAGMKVVVVACDEQGNVDVGDLEEKAKANAAELAALMVTYPSTHGVFEEEIRRITAIVHEHGGQVYMDGANMNAQVGLCRPGDIGADVCHLNLHKTFCIPHGGGGPGMGPIGVAPHLAAFLPGHPLVPGVGGAEAIGPVSAAPWGSPSILPISWAYIRMMGEPGLRRATQIAILNANYVAKRLGEHFPVVYTGKKGRVAHECIVDCRPFKKSAGVEVDDIAKRLMDFGFHAPTMSFPIAGTLMIEPTESESLAELDRFCEAMIAIRGEIRAIEEGRQPREGNVLKHAPHTADAVTGSEWTRPYGREQAAFPLPWVRANKFWPSVARLNNTLGDRNFVCACPPLEDYQ
jgi:glycine dehydrogenase